MEKILFKVAFYSKKISVYRKGNAFITYCSEYNRKYIKTSNPILNKTYKRRWLLTKLSV